MIANGTTKRLTAFTAAVAALLLLAISPANAEWRRAESPNFILYADASEARLRERVLLLEDYHRLLAAVTGVDTPPVRNKLTVYMLDDAGDLRWVRSVGSGAAGLYAASAVGVAAFVSGGDHILQHEYAHHFMRQYAPAPYPLWFVEGFAEYFMTARFTEREIEFGDISEWRIRALGRAGWLRMERVLSGTLRGLNNEQRNRFYAQSWLATHYFYSNAERFAQLRRYLAAAAAGADVPTALQQATGLTPDGFERALIDHIAGGRIVYRRLARTPDDGASPVSVTILPRAADDLMFAQAALHVGQSILHAPPLLERVRSLAARHADDPFARRILARAEAMHGDGDTADRLLDGLLAETPDDVELFYLKGMRHLRASRGAEGDAAHAREAARWFGRAFQADQNHYQTLYQFAQSQRGQPSYAGENNRNVLVLAHSLAPQVSEIRMAAAGVLVQRREFALAESLLLPLAADPHDDRLAQAAQRLLDRARAGRSGPATGAAASSAQ